MVIRVALTKLPRDYNLKETIIYMFQFREKSHKIFCLIWTINNFVNMNYKSICKGRQP